MQMTSTNPFRNPPSPDRDHDQEPQHHEQQEQHQPSTLLNPPDTPNSALQVDFSLKSWKVIISLLSTTSDSPDPAPPALYRIDTQSMRTPQMLFRRASEPSTSTPFATGTLHTFKINPDYTLHDTPNTLTATRRFQTSYTYQSTLFARSPGHPETMTWTSTSGFKNWDFILLDGDMMPVARYSSRLWAVRKWGKIEFLGERARSEKVREEVVVTGLVLFFCMAVRATSIFQLFGACFYRPKKGVEGRERTSIDEEGGERE